MTDEQIEKALEHCGRRRPFCLGCPYMQENAVCRIGWGKDALDYINRLKEQVTQYEKDVRRLKELSDKLESGQLIDTSEYFIQPERVANGKERYLICKRDCSVGIYDFKDTLEQAEARVKELRDKGRN